MNLFNTISVRTVSALLVIAFFDAVLSSDQSCGCQSGNERSVANEPLVMRSFCSDDFAWKVFVRSDSDLDFKDVKNETFSRYAVRVTKVYKDSMDTSIFSEGFLYTPQSCPVILSKTRFWIVFGYYDGDGKPVVSKCQFSRLIDDLSVGERLFLMGAYKRMDCLDSRAYRPPSVGSPGQPGRPATAGFKGPPFIPGLPGLGGVGGNGGLPGVGVNGIWGGIGGTGGNGGTAFGTGTGGHGGGGGPGGEGSRIKRETEVTNGSIAAENKTNEEIFIEKDILTEEQPIKDQKESEQEISSEEKKETEQSDSDESPLIDPTPVEEELNQGFKGIQTPSPLLGDKNKIFKDKIRWPGMGRPGSPGQNGNSGNGQGWSQISVPNPSEGNIGLSPDFNLCSIPSLQDLPQCSSEEWQQEGGDSVTHRPNRKSPTKSPPGVKKPRPPSGWPPEQRPQKPKPKPEPDWEEWEQIASAERPSRPKPKPSSRPPVAEPEWPPRPPPRPENKPKPEGKPKPEANPESPIISSETEWSEEWEENHESEAKPENGNPGWNQNNKPPVRPQKPRPQPLPEAEWPDWNGHEDRPQPERPIRPKPKPKPKPENEWRPQENRPQKPLRPNPKPETDFADIPVWDSSKEDNEDGLMINIGGETPWNGPSNEPFKPSKVKNDPFSCSCAKLRQLEESCTSTDTLSKSMSKFFEE